MTAPPIIFAHARRRALRRRMRALQARGHPAPFLLDDMADDMIERIGFLRHAPERVAIVGIPADPIAATLPDARIIRLDPADGFAEDQPWPEAGFDLIVSLGMLDTVNDLPGALIQARRALAPGGLFIASMMGAGSLPVLRAAMLAADGDRPAPRLHPQIDVRAGGQLLQRAGFDDPVIDSRTLTASYRSLDSLVADLRAQGLSNVLDRHGPPLTRAARARARAAFAAQGEQGRTVETFEILTLTGWKR